MIRRVFQFFYSFCILFLERREINLKIKNKKNIIIKSKLNVAIVLDLIFVEHLIATVIRDIVSKKIYILRGPICNIRVYEKDREHG
jgi:hypothetical protein